MGWLLLGASILLWLSEARLAAAQQIGVNIDPETARLISEMELTRLVLVIIALVIAGLFLIGWRALSVYRSTSNAATAAKQSDLLRQAQADADARRVQAEADAATRKERDGFLGLLWAMQGTMVQSKEGILASNAGYAAQVKAVEAHTAALNLHTDEAKAFWSSIKTEIAGVRTAVDGTVDKIGLLVQQAIMDGMKASAGVFADRLELAMLPISQQLETLNTRLNEPVKTAVEGENHVKEITFKPAGGAAAGDGHGTSAA
jgi:hypothetical protein